MVAEETSGPIDMELVDSVDVADEVGWARFHKNLDRIARELSPADEAIFRRMIIDVDDVPAKERNRVIAAVRKIMELPSRPRSVEYPGEIVEGPSHCGRTARRLAGRAASERSLTALDSALVDAAVRRRSTPYSPVSGAAAGSSRPAALGSRLRRSRPALRAALMSTPRTA